MPGSCSSGFRSRPSSAGGSRRWKGFDANSANARKPAATTPIAPSTRAASGSGSRCERIATATVHPARISVQRRSEPSWPPHTAARRYCSGSLELECCTTYWIEKSPCAKDQASTPKAHATNMNCACAALRARIRAPEKPAMPRRSAVTKPQASAMTPSSGSISSARRRGAGSRGCCGALAQAGRARGPGRLRRRQRRPTRRRLARPSRRIRTSLPSSRRLPLEDHATYSGEGERDAVHPEGGAHDEHALEGHPAGDLRHRVVDERQVQRTGKREHRARPIGAARIVDRRIERHGAEEEGKEDQLRGETRVPDPPGAPGRLAQDRAGPQREEGEHRAGRRKRMRDHERETRIERKSDGGPERHHDIDEDRHPGRGHV